MTISLRVSGAATNSTALVTAISPAVGAGALSGDLSVLSVAAKPFSTTITTPTGWTKIGEATNGTTASTGDAGSTKVFVYVQVGAAVGAIGNLTQSGANTMVAAIVTYSTDLNDWDTANWTSGGDTTDGADYLANASAGIGMATGDRIYGATALNSDAGTLTAASFQNLSGATQTDHQGRTSAPVTTGDDARLYVRDALISVGASNFPPRFIFSNASSTSGTTLFLRLRDLALVVDSSATSWSVTQTVTGSAPAVSWAVTTTVTNSAATSWAVTTVATDSAATTWAVTQAVPDSAATTWAVAAPVTDSAATTWAVAQQVNKTSATAWNVQAVVTDSSATTWDVRAVATDSTSTTWAVITTTTDDTDTAWAVRAAVPVSNATSWNVAAIVTDTVATTWAVTGTATDSTATSWAVATPVTDSAATTWGVTRQVTKASSTVWDTVAAPVPVTASTATTWDVTGRVTDTAVTSWNVAATVTDATVTGWSVAVTATDAAVTTWAVRAAVTGTAGVSWSVLAVVTGTEATTWAVTVGVTDAVAATWQVFSNAPYPLVKNPTSTLTDNTTGATLTGSTAVMVLTEHDYRTQLITTGAGASLADNQAGVT